MSREDDPLFYRLVEEFEAEGTEWTDEEVGKFVEHTRLSDEAQESYENRRRTGHMALGHVIMLPREQRDTLWAKFQVEREQ